ncbi:O-antigen polymerase [Soonwooa sp.]|uniref:O-antigen polymerase n=1 Tax=Soonwooa sp. TaxID=1938592 RepID=UPI002613DE48|nr:O-antigen polymerase [Soonwooa sp.]
MGKIFAFIIVILGFFIAYFAPDRYEYSYSIICGIVYAIIIIMYYVVRKKDNYFDFDSLFFFTLFFVTLYYPIFMYETDATRYVFFLFPFDYHVIPKSSSLAVLGAACYIFGSLFVKNSQETKKVTEVEQQDYRPIKTKKFYSIALVLFVLYVLTGGYQELRSVYFGGNYEANVVAKYINLFCPPFLFAGIICDFYNMKNLSPKKFQLKKISKIAYISIGIIVLGLVFAGSRTIPLQVILMIFGLYSLLYRKISLLRFFTFIIVGLTIMFTIVVSRGYNQDSKYSAADVVMDLIINNRNNFLAVEEVNNHGFTYGTSLLSQFVAPVPFFQNLLLEMGLKEQDITSQKLFTYLTYEELAKFYGVGTTIIADVYIAYGEIGIFFFMAFLGYFINKNRVNSQNSIFSMTIYGVLISYAVYLARAEYFFFMRYLIWTLVVVFFATKKIKFT